MLAAQERDAPESLLPPGFGDPAPAPAPAPAERPDAPAQPRPGAPLTVQPLPAPGPAPSPTPTPTPTPSATPLSAEELLAYELPDYARRSTARVGAIGVDSGGLPANGFGDADGVWLSRLMRHVDAPIASRWLSIALRRMLLSRLDTPARVNGADFAAERAWLLLRMGEAVAARNVVQGVDVENHTPKLYQVAMQVALATGDPAALCPLESLGRPTSPERGWVLAEAMCAGLAGEPRRAAQLADAARRARVARGIDFLLAEKVLGAGAQGRRAVTIEWDDVEQLTAWRYGLAMATGVEIPDRLIETVGPHVPAWTAQMPIVPAFRRLPAAERAAALGVLSNLALVDLLGVLETADDATASQASIARDLRLAYTAPNATERLGVLRQLWDEPDTPEGRFARQILTARAAATIVPAAERAEDAPRLVASMLTAGLDRPAARWRDMVAEGSDAWALIALTDPAARAPLSASAVTGYQGAGASQRKAQLFFAGLAGTGRVTESTVSGLAQSLGVAIGAENAWVRAIRQAAEADQPATVLLLAAVGMQASDWSRVAPESLFHITAALTRVGLEGEARMIAAEAVARS
ncbi:hypothetical protein FBR43_10315 [Sphingomonas baiyangensis]|uniref:Uncharacterized protein n=2 Tax=Sphingomonas baiyangensis TaxID=2572576 RepID=A0A4U1L7A8_9SPHN|nr:hypothetical protein FBR43_10315 [Sphingomonas baiyangensis]